MARQIDCNQLTFSLYPYAHEMKMYESYYRDNKWDDGTVVDFHDIQLSPAANILNYGQGIFEGMKAYYSLKGHVVMFRPEENAKRFERSAHKLAIPGMTAAKFEQAVKDLVRANLDFIPKCDDGRCSMYLRPVCIGIEPLLGVRAAKEYLFYIFASPVGPYFDKVGIVKLTAKNINRASPYGTGDAKAVCNYPVTMRPKMEAIAEGFNDVIYLDPIHNKYIEEAGAANFFALMNDGSLITPPLGTILPGITRESVIRIATEIYKIKVIERDLSVEEVVTKAKECFVTGTAAIITSVSDIGWQKKVYSVNHNDYQLAIQFYEKLINIQLQKEDDPFDWVSVIT
ncbi:MAG: branched-chain amino acid aminotransferase [Calditrichia bacterium]|nr:branched-chain amino acid aminotransferase [Calditrichia bacterium]